MAADAIRAYLRTLRAGQSITQQAVAEEVGVTRLTWGNYELGKNQTVPSDTMLAALRFVNGSFDHLHQLADEAADEALGVRLAERRIEEIAAGAVSSLQATVSDEEFSQYLQEVDRMVVESSRIFPSFRDLLQRVRRRDGDGPRQ